jgi:hypothetical protein
MGLLKIYHLQQKTSLKIKDLANAGNHQLTGLNALSSRQEFRTLETVSQHVF